MKLHISIIAILLLTSCAALLFRGEENPVFYIEKTACYGECPVYRAEIFNTGKMKFSGLRNTRYIGKYCSDIELQKIEMLKEAFRKHNFFSMDDEYISHVKDLPTTITGFYSEGKQKRIIDYDASPAELKLLEKMLETIVDTSSWKPCK